VSTYSHTYSGPLTIQQATLQSDNTVYAQLTLDVGPENVAAMAHKLGVQSPLQPVPSIGLGANAVSPLDMASGYATLAAGGVYSEPMAIRRVVLANGKDDDQAGWGKPVRHRVLPDGVAYTVTKILEQNVLYGTGTRANFGRPAAGKTGTTENHADAWFCGYLPNLEATVWVGYPQAEIPMENVHGIAVAGGSFPAEIWRLFMERAVRYTHSVDFALPRTYPTWKPFQRGDYAIQYVSTDTTSSTTTDTTPTTKEATTAEQTTTEQQVSVPEAPVTTQEVQTVAPPPTPIAPTVAPPPVTTSAPPPPPPEPPATTTVGAPQ
jgi:penicillin-binding protein 1A